MVPASATMLYWSIRGEVACAEHVPDTEDRRWTIEGWAAIPVSSGHFGSRSRYQCQFCAADGRALVHLPSEPRTIGLLIAPGFTFALFLATAAMPAGQLVNETKLGLLMGLSAVLLVFVAAWALNVGRFAHARHATTTNAWQEVAVRFGFGVVAATGVVAGILFAAFDAIATALLMGSDIAALPLMPLRMTAALVLGTEVFGPSYPLADALLTGMVVHLLLSVAFAGMFAAMVVPLLRASGRHVTDENLAVAGIGFGIVLWLVNVYIVAPLAGWTWFPEQTNPVVQFIAHAFLFGGTIGWLLGRSHPVTRARLTSPSRRMPS